MRGLGAGALLGVLLALGGTWALAQEEGGDEGRATSFEHVEGAEEESVPGGKLLVAAYALIWVFLLGFVVLQWRRVRRLEDEVDRLTKALEERPEDEGGGGR